MSRPPSPRPPPGTLLRDLDLNAAPTGEPEFDRVLEQLRDVVELQVCAWRGPETPCAVCGAPRARLGYRPSGATSPFVPACSARCYLRAAQRGPDHPAA